MNTTEYQYFPHLQRTQDDFEEDVECEACYFRRDERHQDLFHGIHRDDDIHVLHLPIKDGYIPLAEQIEAFLKETEKTIAKGKKKVRTPIP